MDGRWWSRTEPHRGSPYISLLPTLMRILNEHVPLVHPKCNFRCLNLRIFLSAKMKYQTHWKACPSLVTLSGNWIFLVRRSDFYIHLAVKLYFTFQNHKHNMSASNVLISKSAIYFDHFSGHLHLKAKSQLVMNYQTKTSTENLSLWSYEVI